MKLVFNECLVKLEIRMATNYFIDARNQHCCGINKNRSQHFQPVKRHSAVFSPNKITDRSIVNQ